jgi:hypothetical protein
MFISPDTEGLDTPEWLQVIHEVNEIRPGTFLDPHRERSGVQWDGKYVEDYPEAWVVFDPEHDRFQPSSRVRVVGKNVAVAAAIEQAAKRLKLTSKEEAA